jgi:hypothetical protein
LDIEVSSDGLELFSQLRIVGKLPLKYRSHIVLTAFRNRPSKDKPPSLLGVHPSILSSNCYPFYTPNL